MTLHEYLAACDGRAFRYGRHDCALFAAGWVRACTGRDLSEGWSYGSLSEGRAQMAARGIDTLEALVSAHLPQVAPLLAQSGDLALVDGRALGIVCAENVHVLRPRGLGIVPLTRATLAWRVA